MTLHSESQVISCLDPEYCVDVLAKMVRINSIVGQEKELAEFIHAELTALGIESRLEDVEPGRPNVYARIRGSRPGKRFHLNGHTDTVPVCDGWTRDPFTPSIENGRLYGLGSCDMKGGLAVIMNTLRAFKLSGLDFAGELSFSAVIDEEAYSKGARAAMTTDFAQCDGALVAEPFNGGEDMQIPLGITGKLLYDITVKGRPAHAFLPHEGINAVEDAARIVAALDRLDMTVHPEFGKGTLSTLKIEGGYQVYSVMVPDRCRIEINRMLVPGETSQSAVDDMRRLIDSLGLQSDVEINLKPPKYEAFVIDRHHPLMVLLHDAYVEVMKTEPHYTYANVITDANVFAGEHGIPCIHLGPPKGNLHQPDEYVELSWLESVSKVYALVATRFLTGE